MSPPIGSMDFMLTDVDRAILRAWNVSYTFPAARAERIKSETGLNPVQSTQRLNELIDTRAALEEFPALTNRLRAFRARHQRSRSARRP